MAIKIIMPKLGESVVEGTVVSWLKKEGDIVEEFESILEVESAKVSTEIPSPASGYLLKILVDAGTTVLADTIIGWIGEKDEILSGTSSLNQDEKINVDSEPTILQNDNEISVSEYPVGRNVDLGFISPVVAKIAQEHHINLESIKGTGQSNRITKKDLIAYIENQKVGSSVTEPAAWETPGEGDLFRPTELQFPDKFIKQIDTKIETKIATKNEEASIKQKTAEATKLSNAVQVIPHTKIRKSIAEHMVLSKRTSPHVTTVMESDLSNVVLHRDANKGNYLNQGVKLTFTAYFISAISQALRHFPIVNSSWSDDGVVINPNINIGMATSLGESGLIVPVLKNTDSYSLLGIARLINDFAERARNQTLKPDEVVGGTFTITNHGTSGSLFATPIINQPQCAILGVGMIQKRVTVISDAIAIRPMVYLSLTFDHRILDGSSADGFLGKIIEILNNWPK